MDVTLPGLPPLGRLIAQAAVTSVGRPSPERGLPSRAVRVHGLAQDAARLAAYDRVCGYALADRVPATWLHVLTFPLQAYLMAQRDFPFPLAGLVHLSNTLTVQRPVGADEALDLNVHVENLAEHRRGHAFDMIGEVRVGDDLVWSGRSVYLARRKDARRSTTTASPAGEIANAAPARRQPLPPVSQRWTLPADLGRQYAAVSGDTNPLHLYPATARLFGFPRPIIHGMWTHARALAALGPRLGERYTASVKFTKPILLPGRATFGVTPTDVGLDFAVMNSDGTTPYLIGGVQPADHA